jgi:deoxyadenosine/deoxycytidine kinase
MIKRIEICGNIASGKTTLAKAFNNAGHDCIFENFSNVVYLDDFYKNPSEYAFETEIAFTLQHYYQLKKAEAPTVISDFSRITDYAFALTTLDTSEFAIYKKMFEHLIDKIGLPERIILLSTPTDELLKRLNERGRDNEKGISQDYLEKVYDNILKVIRDKFKPVKVVHFDTGKIQCQNYNLDLLISLLS